MSEWRKVWTLDRDDGRPSPHCIQWLEYDAHGKKRVRTACYPTKSTRDHAKRLKERELNDWLYGGAEKAWLDATEEFEEFVAYRSRSYRRDLDYHLAGFTDLIKPKTVAGVKPGHVNKYVSSLRKYSQKKVKEGEKPPEPKPITDHTRLKVLRMLSAFFSWAQKAGYAERNPVELAAKPVPKEETTEVPREKDWIRLLETVVDESVPLIDRQGWYLLILLAVTTGIRETALLTVEIRNVEIGSKETKNVGLLKTTEKRRRQRMAGLPEFVSDCVAKRIQQLPEGTNTLFLWPGGFQRKAWNRLRRAAKFPYAFHGLRASRGTDAAIRRAEAAGALALDHSSPAVTRKHYLLMAEVARAVAGAIVVPALPPMPDFAAIPELPQHRSARNFPAGSKAFRPVSRPKPS